MAGGAIWLFAVLCLTSQVHAQGSVFNFEQLHYLISESAGIWSFNIVRTGDTSTSATVTLLIKEVTADYALRFPAPITFEAGQSVRTLELGTTNDNVYEPDRLYTFELTSPSLGSSLGSMSRIFVTYRDDDGPIVMDCMVDGCQNGVCDPDTHLCDCQNTGYVFQDCSLNVNELVEANCAGVSCSGAGACATDQITGIASCHCQPGFEGDTCNIKTSYSVVCRADEMCLHVNPPSSFVGVRYISNRQSHQECYLDPVFDATANGDTIPATWQGTYICLTHQHAVCGDVTETATSLAGVTSVYREVWIRQSRTIKSARDIIFRGTCYYNGTGVVYLNPFDVDPTDTSGLILQTQAESVNVVTVSLIDSITQAPPSPQLLRFGQVVCFRFNGLVGTDSVRLKVLEATVTDTNDNNPLILLEDACQTSEGILVINRMPFHDTRGPADSIDFCIDAFCLDSTCQLRFHFTLAVCLTGINDADCQQTTCPATGVSLGRKKRASENTATVEQVVEVFDPSGASQTGNNGSAAGTCEWTTPIILGFAFMATLALVLLLVTAVLCCKNYRTKYHD